MQRFRPLKSPLGSRTSLQWIGCFGASTPSSRTPWVPILLWLPLKMVYHVEKKHKIAIKKRPIYYSISMHFRATHRNLNWEALGDLTKNGKEWNSDEFCGFAQEKRQQFLHLRRQLARLVGISMGCLLVPGYSAIILLG